jgi:hypothetical protein
MSTYLHTSPLLSPLYTAQAVARLAYEKVDLEAEVAYIVEGGRFYQDKV